VAPLKHIILIPSQQSLLFLLNAAFLAEKQQIPIVNKDDSLHWRATMNSFRFTTVKNTMLIYVHSFQLRRAEGGAKIVGVFRVKNHDFTPKNHIFSNCGGRRENFWGISCEKITILRL
jgi:hypothetical protein